MGRLTLNVSADLSPREMEIAGFIACGRAEKEIADELNISPNTVCNTKANIFRKLGLQKATEISLWYFVKRFSIDTKELPVKIIALVLLAGIIPKDILNTGDTVRMFRTRIRTTARRGGRRNEVDFYDL